MPMVRQSILVIFLRKSDVKVRIISYLIRFYYGVRHYSEEAVLTACANLYQGYESNPLQTTKS